VTIVRALRRVTLLVVAAGLAATSAVGIAEATSPARHALEFRSVLAAVAAADARTATADESAAISSCDPGRVQAITDVPLTPRAALTGTACAVLPFAPGQGKGALFLGPARLTAAEIASAKSTFQSGQGYAVNLRLTRSGLKKFNRLAADLFSKMPPGNEVGMVVDGQVFSNPAFQTNHFSGVVQISGSFTGKEAEQLAATINRARRRG
jgi:preprotein translocase subunit SecD